jgi:hypothetical protein
MRSIYFIQTTKDLFVSIVQRGIVCSMELESIEKPSRTWASVESVDWYCRIQPREQRLRFTVVIQTNPISVAKENSTCSHHVTSEYQGVFYLPQMS